MKSSLVILALSFVLTACGESTTEVVNDTRDSLSSSSTSSVASSSSSAVQTEIKTGVFLDSPIINVGYRTETQNGFTDNNGTFTYIEGETIIFFIGDLAFPAVSADVLITPLDLADTLNTNHPVVINIIRLLQSLDNDNNPSNGISITGTAQGSATQVDFNLSIEAFASSLPVITLVVNGGQENPVTVLIDIEAALQHFEEALEDFLSSNSSSQSSEAESSSSSSQSSEEESSSSSSQSSEEESNSSSSESSEDESSSSSSESSEEESSSSSSESSEEESSSSSSESSEEESSSSSSESSEEESSSSSAEALASPNDLEIIGAISNGVVIDWNTVDGANQYHVFVDTDDNIDVNNTAVYAIVEEPPFMVTDLANGTNYFFTVTAVDGDAESAKSNEEDAEPAAISFSTQPTAAEIVMLELVNRARFDPQTEADLYGIGLNDDLTPGTISAAQKPPLAHNIKLMNSSRGHSQWMLDEDIFDHTGDGGSNAGTRMTAAGYSWSAAAENIAVASYNGSPDLTALILTSHSGLFQSAGHRVNILNATYRELGIGQLLGDFPFGDPASFLDVSMITQNFGSSGSSFFLTGVIYDDSDSDEFYDAGEGLESSFIIINGTTYPVFDEGAFSIPLNNGTYQVTIVGHNLPKIVQETIIISGSNIKLTVRVNGGNTVIESW